MLHLSCARSGDLSNLPPSYIELQPGSSANATHQAKQETTPRMPAATQDAGDDSPGLDSEASRPPRPELRTRAELAADRDAALLAHQKTRLELHEAQRAYSTGPGMTGRRAYSALFFLLIVGCGTGLAIWWYKSPKRTTQATVYTAQTSGYGGHR